MFIFVPSTDMKLSLSAGVSMTFAILSNIRSDVSPSGTSRESCSSTRLFLANDSGVWTHQSLTLAPYFSARLYFSCL